MIRALARLILSDELSAQYVLGWGHGVEQERFEPDSTRHHSTTELEYWGN